MALLQSLPSTAVLTATLFFSMLVFKLAAVIIKKKTVSPNDAPAPSGWLPIIGHLHLLSGKRQLHELLSSWADIYGPAMMLQLGLRRVLVISSLEMAKECFTTNDQAFCNRPYNAAGKYLTDYNTMFGFAPYGTYWREMRKFTTLELLSNRRIESFNHLRAMETSVKLSQIYKLWLANSQQPVKVDMKKLLEDLTYNILVRTVAGPDYVVGHGGDDVKVQEFAQCTRESMNLFIAFVVSDFFPFLEVLDIKGHIHAMKKVGRKLDGFIRDCVVEHRRRRKSSSDGGSHDFIDVLLSHFKEDEKSDRIIRSNALAMIAGGNDSTASTMIRILHMLLLHPQSLKKVQDELDFHVGKHRTVDESDLKNLVYLQAAVKEVLRLSPPAPLLALRESVKDCQVGGFHIPAGTWLFVNVWKIQREPRLWTDPNEFQPERFLNSDMEVSGQHFQFIPFGSGRRVCPGISLALRVMHIAIARLLHSFDLELCPDSFFDESNSLGPNTVLNVVLSPRLPLILYS